MVTLSVTLNGLKLPLTVYQLFAWAAATSKVTEMILIKTFCAGLGVLAAPSRWTRECHENVEARVLSHMQTVALQWAKVYATQPGGLTTFSPMLATGWAAQTALWEVQWLRNDDKRTMALPRLAESMTLRLLQQSQSQSSELQQLALRALRYQHKWEEMLEIVEKTILSSDEVSPSVADFGVSMTRTQALKEKCQILFELGRYDIAESVYEELLDNSPDDWDCWKGHLECCRKQDKVSSTKCMVDRVLEKQAGEKYALRGPRLMTVELAADALRSNPSVETIDDLVLAIEDYAEKFAAKAACTFSDLAGYLELLLSFSLSESQSSLEKLLAFLLRMRSDNCSTTGGEITADKVRQARLRVYIFATKLNHKILAAHSSLLDKWLPDWDGLVTEWKASLSMSSVTDGEESQREVKPGDDLILLAVQQLLFLNPQSTKSHIVSATLLESAIEHSPDNAYLKMAAIDVYYQLDSLERSWELFEGMGIKHIQLDSCSFTILPYLQRGGLYNEAVNLCSALLRFQISTARDCGDYAGRAMEKGTIGKANEFLVFQRQKMNKSLSVLDAKGIILDCAPLMAMPAEKKAIDDDPVFKGCLGGMQGIVGGDQDVARATQMTVEVYNPYAALSIVSWASNGGVGDDYDQLADNRDLSIQSLSILRRAQLPTKKEMCMDALRRGHIHGLLIRGTLCLDAAKGPKKGKIVKLTDDLEKRTSSLLRCVHSCDSLKEKLLSENSEGVCCKALLSATLDLLRVLAMIAAGLPSTGNDSIEDREQRAYEALTTNVKATLRDAKESSLLSVKSVCYLLPNFVVPLYATFVMCAKICDLYGWGKRKHKSKRCAEALREVARDFLEFLSAMVDCISTLPGAEEGDHGLPTPNEYSGHLEESIMQATLQRCHRARTRTRLRIEPILIEMSSNLASFVINDDQEK